MLVSGKKIYAASDSLASCDDFTISIKTEKVFRNKNYIIGYAGAIRHGQLIRRISKQIEKIEIEYIPDIIFDTLKDGKCILDKDVEFQLIIGNKGNLYGVDNMFQLIEFGDNYHSIGSGSFFALGVLYSLNDEKIDPLTKVIKSIEAAIKFSPSVGGDIKTMVFP